MAANTNTKTTIYRKKVTFEQAVPSKYDDLVELAKKLWYSGKVSAIIKAFGYENKDSILQLILLHEAQKAASGLSFKTKNVFEAIVAAIGVEYLDWMEFCDRSVYFSSEDYSPERCQWTKYLTIDRLKSVCPNQICSNPSEICKDCKNKYVTSFLEQISVNARNHLNQVFEKNVNYAVALWITNDQAHGDSLEHARRYFEEFIEENDAYRMHLIEGQPNQNLILMGVLTGNVMTIDHYTRRMRDPFQWMVVVKRFIEVWPNSKKRSYSVGYTLAMNKLDHDDQILFANVDITRKLFDWDRHRLQIRCHGWPVVSMEKEEAEFIAKLDRLCSAKEIRNIEVFQLINETNPRVRNGVINRLGPIIWKLLNRERSETATIKMILGSYNETIAYLTLFTDIDFITRVASIRKLRTIDRLVHPSDGDLHWKLKAAVYLLANRYIKTNPEAEIVTTMLTFLFFKEPNLEKAIQGMLDTNRVFHLPNFTCPAI